MKVMSVELKLKTLAEYIGADYLDRIENEDDIVFHTQDDSYYVLTERERNSLAWDILYHEHDSEWYGIDENYPTLDDIMNYECTGWWAWPQENLIALYKSPNVREHRKQYILEHITY